MQAREIILNLNGNQIKHQRTDYRNMLKEKLYGKNSKARHFTEKDSEVRGDKQKIEIREIMRVLIGVENNCQ